MKNKLLLPRICRPIGCIIFPLGVAWLIAHYVLNLKLFTFLWYNNKQGDDSFWGPEFLFSNNKQGDDSFWGPEFLFSKGFTTDFIGELSILITLFSLFMIAFSKEKVEDEYVSATRLHALQVSVYLNFLLTAIASILIYGLSYIYVLQSSMYSILIIYIVVFSYHLHIKPRFTKSITP